MYPRNAASPERIAIGAVVQISDGAVQTSGVSISVRGQGGASGAGSGTTAYDNGIVQYTPTQGETDFTSFVVVAYKSGCIPVAQTIVTGAGATPGVTTAAVTIWNGVALGTTNPLPNAAPDAAGGLPISDAGGLDIDTLLARLDAAITTRSSHSAADVWAVATRVLTAGTNIALAKGTGVTGFNDLDAAGVRAAVGLASANLDTQLAAIAGYIDTEIGAIISALSTLDGKADGIKAVTDNLPDSGALTSLASAAKLLAYVRLLARKDAAIATDAATELGEINADAGSGAGAYDNAADALEAHTDNGVTVKGLSTAAKAEVEAEVIDALDTAIGTPTAGSPLEILDDLAALLPATTIAAAGDDMNASEIAGSSDAATRLAESAKAIATGTVVADGANTADSFEVNLGTPDDKVLGRVLFFVTGTLRYQGGVITDYVASTGFVTVETDSFTTTPTAGDTFAIN